jgi:hypothetical protein
LLLLSLLPPQCPYKKVIPVMKQGIEMTMMFGGLLGGLGQPATDEL